MSVPITRYVADAVVTGDDAVYQPGVVDVSGTTISWVGSPDEAPAHDAPTHRLDGLLMPGFVNAHGHAPMTLFRGTAEGVTLDAFLRDVLWPRERRLTAEDVYWGTTLACAEMQRAAVTTSCEMYFYEEAMLAAFLDAGSRYVLTPVVFEVPGWELFSSWERRLAGVTAFLDAHSGVDPLIGIAAHSAYALSLEGLDAVAAAARERGALLHLHLAESRDETRELQAAAGPHRPARRARVLRRARPRRARRLAQRRRPRAARCPRRRRRVLPAEQRQAGRGHRSSARHAARRAAGRAGHRRAGVQQPPGQVGRDEGRGVNRGSGHRTGRRPQPAEALALATRGGAEALGRTDLGVLAPGHQADLVLVRTDDPAFVPVLEPADLLSHIVWAASSALVSDVWIAGEQVVRAGACTRIGEARARHEVQQRAARLRSS